MGTEEAKVHFKNAMAEFGAAFQHAGVGISQIAKPVVQKAIDKFGNQVEKAIEKGTPKVAEALAKSGMALKSAGDSLTRCAREMEPPVSKPSPEDRQHDGVE